MIDKKVIIQMAEHVFRKSQDYPDRRLMHPNREWGIGLVFFICIVLTGSVLSGNVFVKYRNVGNIKGSSGESIPQYREVIVKDALEAYRIQSAAYNELRGQVPVVVPVDVVSVDASSTVEATEGADEEIEPIF